jgi:hypothetical protein
LLADDLRAWVERLPAIELKSVGKTDKQDFRREARDAR